MSACRIIHGHVIDGLRSLPAGSVHCCVTSPPYFGLRDYGCEGQIGLEATPEAFVASLVAVFAEVRRVLRDDGCLWLNLGDTYNAYNGNRGVGRTTFEGRAACGLPDVPNGYGLTVKSLKPKDLIGIPWMVAFALRADGWYLRSDVIWCLSGGTWVYARTQKGDAPMMIRDVARLRPETVQLWNGKQWTQLLGVSKSKRQGDELEFVLRSGERISCTPTHQFPTQRGLLAAAEMRVGDVLETCRLPEPDEPKRAAYIGKDAAWLAGLYVAEGSRSEDTIQIAGHAKESERWDRCQEIAAAYGGYATRTVDGNKMHIRLYGKVLSALLCELVTGKTAKDKALAPVCWRYDDAFLRAFLDGYLSGDGHFDRKNNRWRLGFCRNYNLERDLRTLCARLGLQLTLNFSTASFNGKTTPSLRGEIREQASLHHNAKPRAEVVEIRKARCREVYDLGVADEPHLFALASGVLTHNSKPNPMPESVLDRPTKSHEYLFLLTKSASYYYDAEAIKEPGVIPAGTRAAKGSEERAALPGVNSRPAEYKIYGGTRNKRSVWTIQTEPYAEAHFATFPPALVLPCLLAGCPERCCPHCGAGWVREVERGEIIRTGGGFGEKALSAEGRRSVVSGGDVSGWVPGRREITTTGYRPGCTCPHTQLEAIPGTVLDPFLGSGTTAEVALEHFRHAIGCELSAEYVGIAKARITRAVGMFTDGGVTVESAPDALAFDFDGVGVTG